jgi:putative nucleotidyltransferase with HDIG domain
MPRIKVVDRIRYHLTRWLPLLAVAMVTYLAFPPPTGQGPPLPRVGQVAKERVVAPFTFVVRKSQDELAREGEARALGAQPVYRFSAAAYDSAMAAARSFFADLGRTVAIHPDGVRAEGVLRVAAGRVPLDETAAAYLADSAQRRALQETTTHFLAEALTQGVADAGVIRNEPNDSITLLRGETERVIPRDSVVTFADLMERAEAAGLHIGTPVGRRTLRRLVGAFYRPTIVPDQMLTSVRRDRLRAGVDPVKYEVRAGERIVAPGETITEEVQAKLGGLAQERRRHGERGLTIRAALGALLFNVIVLSAFWLLLVFYRRESYRNVREMLFFAGLFSLLILMTAGVTALFPERPELIPIPFVAILLTMLYSGRVGLFGAVALAILLDGQPSLQESHILFFGLVGGVAGAVGIRVVRRRYHLYRTMAVIAGGNALASITVGLIEGWGAPTITMSISLGALMAPAWASFAMILLPVAESATKITTDLTLLELSDLGRPLLRRLAVEAPGTWAHSLAMANLCESACNMIGANGLLARVGCYYHDVGKLGNPGYFMENQGGGPNPHDDLPPQESAKIIRRHVLDGIALAEDSSLPNVVKAFIPEHHGTSDIAYFVNRARRQDRRVDLAEFCYPGPRPQSAETAVAMLADSAEAVVRVLDDRSPDAVRDAIEQLVQQKLASGQLDDAPLTLRDLDRVKREFARVMSGTYHKRIGYPRASGAPTPEFQSAKHE